MTQNIDVFEPTAVDENIEETVDFATEENKKFPLQKTIIISLCIFVAALIGYFTLFLCTPTVEGTWMLEAEDGNKYYYTITETKDGYDLDVSLGTIGWPGKCIVDSKQKEPKINIDLSLGEAIYDGGIYGAYTYDISGGRFSKNSTMTLVGANGNKFTLKKTERPAMASYTEPFEGFKPNQALLGTWKVDLGMGQNFEITFSEDGVLSMYYYNGVVYENYFYKVEDSVVLRRAYASEKYEDQLDFQITDDGLVFMNILWTKVVNK